MSDTSKLQLVRDICKQLDDIESNLKQIKTEEPQLESLASEYTAELSRKLEELSYLLNI